MNLTKIYNPILKFILRSPLHSMISKSIMLITFTGRKSGKEYTTPVNYIHDGEKITVFSLRKRIWWRNPQGGGEVIVRLKGQYLKAFGESIEYKKEVAAGLMDYLQISPQYAKYFQVTLDPNGQPNPEKSFELPEIESWLGLDYQANNLHHSVSDLVLLLNNLYFQG